MEISMRFYSTERGVSRTNTNLPLDLGEPYFAGVSLRNTETHVSLLTYILITKKPVVFSEGISEVYIPGDRVTLKWSSAFKWVEVITTNKNPSEAYKIHRKYCEKYIVQAENVFGQVVIMPKNKWVTNVLIWIYSLFNIEEAGL